jgi:hypothetical protein
MVNDRSPEQFECFESSRITNIQLSTCFSGTDLQFEKFYEKKPGNDWDFQPGKRGTVEGMIIPPAGPTSQPFRIHQVIIGTIAGRAMYPVYLLNLAEEIIKCPLFCLACFD